MHVICFDLEGVFVPEIWINVAEKTGIEELRLTTRDIADYDVLMRKRLSILDAHGLKLKDITDVIDRIDPLEGAKAFIDWLRERTQVVILSDTFVQFAGPLMRKLGWPTLLCNELSVAPDGSVSGYHLRQSTGKRMAVIAFKSLYYRVVAVGDSYNDIAMIKEADTGILFRPPPNIVEEFPELPVTTTYDELREIVEKELAAGR
jgi:phosphoserine/homoserine phosphotransferase